MQALERTRDVVDAEVVKHPFELNPQMGAEGEAIVDYLGKKYGRTPAQIAETQAMIRERGASVGFTFGPRDFVYNTFDAHRLLLWSATQGRQFLMDKSSYREAFVLNRPARNTAPAASKSAPGIDSSRLVEFPNAYTFAQQSGLLLPPGLVAVRPPVPSAHSAKIGAFKFTRGTEPGILVVLSVEEQPAVELFFVSRIVGTGRPFWNFVRGTLQNNTLEVFPTSQAAQHIFRWSDGNAGDLTIMPRQHTTSDRILASRFARLD